MNGGILKMKRRDDKKPNPQKYNHRCGNNFVFIFSEKQHYLIITYKRLKFFLR